MIETVWITLYVTGLILVLIQYQNRRASVPISILSLAVWVVTAFSALGIDVVRDAQPVYTSEELAAVVVAIGFALYSFLLLLIGVGQALAGDVDETTEQGSTSSIPSAFKGD